MRCQGGDVRAFTLVELLVGMFLTSLLTLVLYRVAAMGYRVGHEEIQRSSLEAKVVLVTKKLKDDLAYTATAGVSLSAEARQLLLHPIDKVLPSGRMLFGEQFIHWSREAIAEGEPARLTRSEILSRPDSQPFDGSAFRWTPEQMMALAAGAGDKTSLVVEKVTHFQVKNLSEVVLPQVGPLLGYEVAIELPIATTRRSIRMSGAAQVRNARS